MNNPEGIPTEDISLTLEKLVNTILPICDKSEWLDVEMSDEDIMNALIVFMNICNHRQWLKIYSTDSKLDPNSEIVKSVVNWTATTLSNYVLQTTGIDTTTYYQKKSKDKNESHRNSTSRK